MSEALLPGLPPGLSYFADWRDLVLASGGLLALVLLIVWWSQQTNKWFQIVVGTFLAAFAFTFVSIYLFVVPPSYAGCPAGCAGWRGYPLPVALIERNGQTQIGEIDFGLDLLLLWLLILVASLIVLVAARMIGWENRNWRTRTTLIVVLIIVPWALLPRFLDPPQPFTTGEELRLVNNARRAAESTYRLTGLWLQRLALEDLRQLAPNPLSTATTDESAVRSQVCLRGYTYFYIPWRRYRINLEATGVTALGFTELPLTGSCWEGG